MASLQAEKQAMRAAARARRAEAARAVSVFGDLVCTHFRRCVRIRPAVAVAGYLPLGEEADPRSVMRWLRAAGHPIGLPRIVRTHAPLSFRAWEEGDALDDGPFGTRQPREDAPAFVPEILILPLLAFDRRGFRLGYGGGYYDRTLAALHAERAVTTIGIAFAAQEVPAVPHDWRDQPLDWIVTERGAIRTETKD